MLVERTHDWATGPMDSAGVVHRTSGDTQSLPDDDLEADGGP
jgi:hypothetical protein